MVATLTDVLDVELRRAGVSPDFPWEAAARAGWVWKGPSRFDPAALRAAALVIDGEMLRFEEYCRIHDKPIRRWTVLWGGAPPQASPEYASRYWCQPRGLMRISAYSELHARYKFVLDFTGPGSESQTPYEMPFPEGYHVPVSTVLERLVWQANGATLDAEGLFAALAELDMGNYTLVPCYPLRIDEP